MAHGKYNYIQFVSFYITYQLLMPYFPSFLFRPVSFFSYLTSGPLRKPILQFYADQTIFTRRLVDIKANSKFHAPDATADEASSGKPENLASVVAHLKTELNVQFVYCWHGLAAYWSGIAPDSSIMGNYDPQLVYANPTVALKEIEPSLLWNPAVLAGIGAAADPAPLFRDMHSYLAAAGITGVKVDCQAGVSMMGASAGGGPSVAARYHASLEKSVSTHFPNNDVINCMCHSTENIYRWRDTALARASDDFYPTDRASHLPHLAACAYNGVFLSPLALPDFDMFQSRHPAAEIHAAARAVSGGPVYVSDAPGSHGFDLLKKLVLPDGTVLRCRLPGRPTRDCLFKDVMRDDKSLLKIWNVNVGTGVVGVFNIQGSSWDRTRRRFVTHASAPPPLMTTVRVTDIDVYRVAMEQAKRDRANAAAVGSQVSLGEAASEVSDRSSTTGIYRTSGAGNGKESSVTQGNGGTSGYSSDSEASAATTFDWLPWERDSWAHVHVAAAATDITKGIDGGIDEEEEENSAEADGGYVSDVSSESGNGVSDREKNGRRNNGSSKKNRKRNGEGEPLKVHYGCNWAAYINSTDQVLKVKADEDITVRCESGQAAIVTFAPISSAFGVDFAPLGLTNMLNGGGAVVSTRVEPEYPESAKSALANAQKALEKSSDDSAKNSAYVDLVAGDTTVDLDDAAIPNPLPRFILRIKGRGTFVAYCSKSPTHCTVDGYEVPFNFVNGRRLSVDIPQIGKHVEQQVTIEFD